MSDQDHTETLRRERKRFFWKIEGELLFSDAFKAIARDGQTVTTYLLILARQPLPPNRKDRIRLEKAGLWPPKGSSFSFPLREAKHHGLTEKGLASGLQRLHEVGIIDRIRAGSPLKGDFALYVLSERWRGFGRLSDGTLKPTFKSIPWPKGKPLSEEEERKRRDTNGKFIRRRGRKNLVAAFSAATYVSLTVNPAATHPPVAAKSAVNSAENGHLVAAESAVLLSSPYLVSDLREVKKVKMKVWTPDSRSQGAAAETRRDDANTNTLCRITDDPKALFDLAEALSTIVGHLSDEGMAKKKPGRPRRNLDPSTALKTDPDYDPTFIPWAEDEPMVLSGGGCEATH